MSELIDAVSNSDINTVEKLLDIDFQDNYGDTALIEATRANWNSDIAQLLLERGADPNIKNNNGFTALILASKWGRVIDTVRVLLKKGADINAITNNGYTALMWASLEGNVDTVKLLLNNGANPNIRNNDGNTAIQVAENVYNQLGIAKWEGNIERREELMSIFANIIELLEDNIRLSRTQKASQQLQASRLPIDYESSMRVGKYLSRMPLHNPDVSRKIKEEETQEEERQHKEMADYLNTLAQYGGKKKRKKSKKKLKKKKNK